MKEHFVCEPKFKVTTVCAARAFCSGNNLLNKSQFCVEKMFKVSIGDRLYLPEDRWSCIAHLSAEDMLKSAVIEEKKFKHIPRVGADNPFGPKF